VRVLSLILAAALAASASLARESTYVYPPSGHTLGFDRIGEWELKLFMGLSASYDNPQGLAAVKLKSQDDPDDKEDDVWLTLFGVNSGKGQIVYNPSRFEVASFGKEGSGKNRFQDPLGIAANDDGRLAVADFGNSRIVFLKVVGKHLQWNGESGELAGRIRPTDVAWGGGWFWVIDAAGGRILRFGADGEGGEVWPHEGPAFDRPRGIEVLDPGDPWTRCRDFRLLVVDEGGKRLRLFEEEGRPKTEVPVADILDESARFIYPAADLYGNFVLADSVGGRLVKLDPQLRPLATMRSIDSDPKLLDRPRGAAIWRRYGQVFLVEENGGAYLWTGTDILSPSAEWGRHRSGRNSLVIRFGLSEVSRVSFWGVNDGREVELRQESRHRAGQVSQWIHDDGRLDGLSEIILRASPTYSARKILTVEKRLPMPEKEP